MQQPQKTQLHVKVKTHSPPTLKENTSACWAPLCWRLLVWPSERTQGVPGETGYLCTYPPCRLPPKGDLRGEEARRHIGSVDYSFFLTTSSPTTQTSNHKIKTNKEAAKSPRVNRHAQKPSRPPSFCWLYRPNKWSLWQTKAVWCRDGSGDGH